MAILTHQGSFLCALCLLFSAAQAAEKTSACSNTARVACSCLLSGYLSFQRTRSTIRRMSVLPFYRRVQSMVTLLRGVSTRSPAIRHRTSSPRPATALSLTAKAPQTTIIVPGRPSSLPRCPAVLISRANWIDSSITWLKSIAQYWRHRHHRGHRRNPGRPQLAMGRGLRRYRRRCRRRRPRPAQRRYIGSHGLMTSIP